jgi:hypothetical protein
MTPTNDAPNGALHLGAPHPCPVCAIARLSKAEHFHSMWWRDWRPDPNVRAAGLHHPDHDANSEETP